MLVRDKRDRAITCVFCRNLHLTLIIYCLVFYKKICLKEGEVWRKVFSNKLLSHLSRKVCHLLSSSVLLCKFTNISSIQWQ